MTSLPPAHLKGYLLAISAAIFWGVSGTCAQFLFENRGFKPEWLVNVRLLSAGLLLLLITGIRGKTPIWSIWSNRKDVFQLLIFSVLGMAMVQYTYFAAIGFSNAATATVLQYIGPAFIVAWYAIRNRKWPVAIEFIALTLAITGTFLLVTHGSFKSLSVTPKAFVWGMLAALTLAFYTIQPAELLKKYSPAAVTGWGMLIGGIGFSVIGKPWTLQGQWDFMTWICFAFIILLGTLAAFFFFLTAVKMTGAKTASLLACAEPLSAAVTAVIWLNVPFGWIDWLGTICILATIIVLTLAPKKRLSEVPG